MKGGDAGPDPRSSWWQGRYFILAALILAAVPLLLPTTPPMLDLPGHMASYAVSIAPSDSPLLTRFYSFDWRLIGNLGVDLVMMPVGHLFGVETGAKLVAIAIPVLTVAGMLLIAREIHGRLPPTVGFALPLAYCYPLWFGFMNYCLGMALALLAFALWLRLSRTERLRQRAVTFAIIALIVWLSHAVAWLLLATMCGASELHRQVARQRDARRSLLATALACLPLCTAVVLMALQVRGDTTAIKGWLQPALLAKGLASIIRDRWIAFDLICTFVIAAVIGIAVLRLMGLRLRAALAWPAFALLAVYVLLPKDVGDSGYIGMRVAPYSVALLVLAIEVKHSARLWATLAATFFIVRIASLTASARA